MAVDALIAMTILASTVVLALQASVNGLKSARAGLELRQANDLLRFIVENTFDKSGFSQGQTAQFRWSLSVGDPQPTTAAASLCAHLVQVTSIRSAKTYQIQTEEICPTPSPL